MSNNVVNVFTVHAADSAAIADQLAQLQAELSASGALHSGRTVWEPRNEEPLRFISAWVPDDHLHELLVRRLAAVCPAVIVENAYCEEFLQAVGVQLFCLQNDAIKSIVVDQNLAATEELATAAELERCEADLNRYRGDDERYDLAFDEYIAASRQHEDNRQLYIVRHQEHCRQKAFVELHSNGPTSVAPLVDTGGHDAPAA